MARLFPLAILLITGCSAVTVAPASLPLDADSVDRVVIELPDLTSRRVAVSTPESAPLESGSVSPHDSIADEPLTGSSPVVEFGLRWVTAHVTPHGYEPTGRPATDDEQRELSVLRRNHPVFGHRQYGIQEVCDEVPRRFAWVDERAPTAAELTSGSLAEVRRRLPTPRLATSPEATAFVNLDTWLGVAELGSLSAGVEADGHHARVTATPVTVDYLSSHGDIRCAPGPPRMSCAITVDRRGQTLAITARVTWAITYSSSVGDGRLNPLTTESVTMLPVDEIQTVSR